MRGVEDVAPYTFSAILVGNVGVGVLDDPPPKAELPAAARRKTTIYIYNFKITREEKSSRVILFYISLYKLKQAQAPAQYPL